MILSLSLMLLTSVLALYLALAHPRSFALFLLPAGLLHFGADLDSAGGLADLSAVWLLVLIVISLIAICGLGRPHVALAATEICYLVFLGWCAVESFRAQEFSFAVRGFLRLLFPLLSMYLARRAVDNVQMASRLLKYQFRATLAAGIVWTVGSLAAGRLDFLMQLTWSAACYFDHAAIVVMLTVATWRFRRQWRFALLALYLIFICLTAVNRTTILALTAAASVFFTLEHRKLAVIVLPALFLGAATIMVSVPAFREKMFYQPEKASAGSVLTTSDLTSSNFNSDGRFAMWAKVLDTFFWPDPIMGSGLGSTQAWFYDGRAKEALHTQLRVEHSDYVKLLSDTGLIGLGLFVACFVCGLVESGLAYRRAADPTTRIFAIGAVCAIAAFMVCMAFDNALLYVLPAAQFPLAFAGIAGRLVKLPGTDSLPATPRPPSDSWRLSRRAPGQRFGEAPAISIGTAPAVSP